MLDDTLHGEGPDDLLACQALLYASGELEDEARAAFEERLATDQAAREALCQAMELSAALAGHAPAAPDPSYRDRVRERLQVGKPPRRTGYRGHPLLWIGMGAAAAVLIMMLLQTPSAPPQPQAAPPVAQVPVRPPASEDAVDPEVDAEPMLEIATYWAEMHNSRHLAQAVDDETRRRQRVEERFLRTEQRRPRSSNAPVMKN